MTDKMTRDEVLAALDATVEARRSEWFRAHDKYFGKVAGIDKELGKLKAAENEAIEARAAVAELIAAHAGLLAQVGAGTSADYRALQETGVVRRSRAALARVGGGA